MKNTVWKNASGAYEGVAVDDDGNLVAQVGSATSANEAENTLNKITGQIESAPPKEESPESIAVRTIDERRELEANAGAQVIEDEEEDGGA